jgi:hypothetical protein
MRSTLRIGLVVALPGSMSLDAVAQKELSTAEAKEHFGENATVWGEVVTARYATSSKGKPTFVNHDKPFPTQIFTVVI